MPYELPDTFLEPAGAVAVAAPEVGGELEDFSGLVRLGEALATP